MGRLAFTLVVLFLIYVAFCWAAEFPENDVSTGDLPSIMPESTGTIPADSGDSDGSKQPENDVRTLESNDVTTVTFRPAEHRLDGLPMMPLSFRPPFRLCRHCPRRVIPHGNDMILGSDSEGSLDPAGWTRVHRRRHHHHHHGKPEFEEKGQMFQMKWHNDDSDDDDDDLDHHPKRFHHGRRHFKREDDEEENDGRHHHHHHDDDDDDDDDHYPKRFHHGRRHFKREDDEEEHDRRRHHHHHHNHKDDEEENGGFLAKFRKFLMDRF